MKLKPIFLVAFGVCYFSLSGLSQQLNEIKKQLDENYVQAMHYEEISLYGESIGKLDQVIRIARKHGYEEKEIEANIAKAELFRKTENFDRGIALLYKLRNTERYPRLHVQKLGRLAALYAEDADFSTETQRDSVRKFVEEGIAISTRLGLREEEAGLRNELGFSQTRNKQFDIGLKNLQRARKLFREIGDEENEMGVRINILDMYVGMGDLVRADSIYPILVQNAENTDWYAIKSKLYKIISTRYWMTGDLVKELQWAELSHGATVSQAKLINSNQMASFKVINDTERFKEESFQKSIDLERQKSKTQQLVLFISVLVLIIVIVILIFFREKRLKYKLNTTVQDLNVMNEKYEMLIIESNHRIKNNLQMIISMLEFTKRGTENSDTDVIKSMSGKIQTISALHKHLYVDVHNEFVDLETYFTEILNHYRNIGLEHSINKTIYDLKVRSERIVYFGLILNEMLSNTLEHANSNEGVIILNVELLEDRYVFSYSDGSKYPENSKQGMGTKLIEQLVGRIKGTNYQINKINGTYRFEFFTS